MSKLRMTLRCATAAALITAVAVAVQYGEPDNGRHPYVGLVVFYRDAGATQPLWRCTGTLISSTIFLTAGHCAYDPVDIPVKAQVWFNDTMTGTGYPFTGGVLGTPIAHPLWNGSLTIPGTHDVGVVVLASPVTGRGFGALPAEGVLDKLATQRGLQDLSIKIVGYGLQGVRPVLSQQRTRYLGWTRLVNLRSALTDGYNVQLSSNPGNWSGGTCFGDSGGPIFLGDTNLIVGVNSFVMNENCKGSGFAHRVDIADSRTFLDGYVSLP